MTLSTSSPLPLDCVVGVETEFQCFLIGDDRRRHSPEVAAERVLKQIQRDVHLKSAAVRYPGWFRRDASLWYFEGNNTLEVASPEFSSPFALATYIHDSLESQLAQLQQELHIAISGGNIAYPTQRGPGNSRGHHYSCWLRKRPDHDDLSIQLTPHLVSSLIIRGGGGFDSRPGVGGMGFRLSPRTCWLGRAVGSDSAGRNRPLYDTWEEPLGVGSRLHCLCDDYNRSSQATAVRLGSRTAIVSLIEQGVSFHHLALQDALSALHTLNADPSLTATILLKTGEALTALELNWRLFALCERHLELLPAWGEALLRLWKKLLLQLTEYAEHDTLPLSLDWPTQFILAEQLLTEVASHVRLEDLPHFDAAYSVLARQCEIGSHAWRVPGALVEMSPREAMNRLAADPASLPFVEKGFRFEDLLRLLENRPLLHQQAAEFFFFGEQSHYAVLEPHLDHRLDLTDVPKAKPTRAAARSRAVKIFGSHPDAKCDWTHVSVGPWRADLSNPLETDLHFRLKPESTERIPTSVC